MHELDPSGQPLSLNAHKLGDGDGDKTSSETKELLLSAVTFLEKLCVPTLNKLEELDPDNRAVPSLCISYISPGDVLFIPPGVLIVDKSLNANSMALRVPSVLVDDTTGLRLKMVERFGHVNLGKRTSFSLVVT